MDAMKCPTCGEATNQLALMLWQKCPSCEFKDASPEAPKPPNDDATRREWDLAKIAARFHAGIREDAIWLAQVRA
jgi:hypothetical protein